MFLKAGGCWLRLDRILVVRTYVEDGEPRADVTLEGAIGPILRGPDVDELLTELERLRQQDWSRLAERGLDAVERLADRYAPRPPRHGGPAAPSYMPGITSNDVD